MKRNQKWIVTFVCKFKDLEIEAKWYFTEQFPCLKYMFYKSMASSKCLLMLGNLGRLCLFWPLYQWKPSGW